MSVHDFDKGWKFHLGDYELSGGMTHTESYMSAKAGGARGCAARDFDASGMEDVELPHDWAVYGEFSPEHGPAQGYKPRGKGWYKKLFRLPEEDKNKELYLEFGGISTHSIVFINGSVAARNFSGYNSFIVNITDMALFGESVNDVTVFADASVGEGWWYEGAGIYRHVKLHKKEKVHIPPWGVYVHPKKVSADTWDTLTDITVKNAAYEPRTCKVKAYIVNAENNTVGKDEKIISLNPGEETIANLSLLTYSPLIWDIDSPNLHSMVAEIYEKDEEGNDVLLNRDIVKFGYRTIEISKNDGFFLNGRRVQLYGTCNHQDHAGVGVAVPDKVNEYRIKLLKEMGSNAYRCSHGNPSPEILDYCDKYGLLVMDEIRNFNTSPDGLKQAEDMVIRDRNHPSVVMYSIFNEEPLQGTPTGRRLAERLQNTIKRLDSDRFTVGAMNTGFTEANGACDVLDMTGFNYNTYVYDEFREKFPEMPMIGSENDSAFQTRGVYKTDHEKHIIDCYDSEAAAWGNTYRDGFKQVDIRPHIMGLFIWTGFDYRGEPTPFEWPSIGTQFGIMDTCGFKKDAFYLNKAFFTKEPMIHVLPHWNFEKGETVKIMVHTNCPEAEIFINGQSIGRKPVDKYDMAEWETEFVPGELRALGYNGDIVCEDSVKTAGTPSKLMLDIPFDSVYEGDGFPVNVSAVDENGIFVPYCCDKVKFSVTGGKILGVGNGDPNSHEKDKADERHLFNGLAQCIVEADTGMESVTVTVSAEGMEPAEITVPVEKNPAALPVVEGVSERYISTWRVTVEVSEDMPDASVKIEDHDMNTWGIVSAGSGLNSSFDGKAGYCLYKTTANIPDDGKAHKIVFKEITGTEVWIYMNDVQAANGKAEWGRSFELETDKTGDIYLAVIIYCDERGKGGLTKPVVMI